MAYRPLVDRLLRKGFMRQYQLDEIARNDIPRVREYLDEHAIAAGVEDIWWVDLQEDLLSPEQFSHPDCRPFRFAVEVGDNFVRFEFLIRSRETMRCACIGYATRVQRDFILAFADRLVEELALRT
jgi:hypothetical protein